MDDEGELNQAELAIAEGAEGYEPLPESYALSFTQTASLALSGGRVEAQKAEAA